MAKEQKMDKSTFMKDGRGPNDIPEVCRDCFGYSNWGGPREEIPYSSRDCSDCPNKPEGF